jgi:sec-independent protein translocase protein TatC
MSSDGKEPQDGESGERTTDLDQDRQQPEGAVSREDSPPDPVEEPAEYGYEYEYQEEEIDEAEKAGAEAGSKSVALAEPEPAAAPVITPPKPPPPPSPPAEEEDDDEGMARMSFLEHLEELRTRIVRVLIGVAVIYLGALAFADVLFAIF